MLYQQYKWLNLGLVLSKIYSLVQSTLLTLIASDVRHHFLEKTWGHLRQVLIVGIANQPTICTLRNASAALLPLI